MKLNLDTIGDPPEFQGWEQKCVSAASLVEGGTSVCAPIWSCGYNVSTAQEIDSGKSSLGFELRRSHSEEGQTFVKQRPPST